MKQKIICLSAVLCLLQGAVCFSQALNFTDTPKACAGQMTTLVASSMAQGDSVTSWSWDLNNDGIFGDANGKIISYLFSAPDSVNVGLAVVTKSGAMDTAVKFIVLNPLPNVNFFTSILCEGQQATFTSTSTISTGSITQYQWDFDNNNTIDFTGNPATYVCGPAQTYIAKLICVSDKGCTSYNQKTTTVNPNPVASFTSANACMNANATFTNTSTATNLDFYKWNFGDGNSNSTQGNATHTYTTAGTYTVDLIAVTLQGCRDTTSGAIIINPLPSVSISGNVNLCMGDADILTASGGTSYAWSTGASTASISVTPTASSSYSVTATDGNGCSASTSAMITPNPLPMISISGKDTIREGKSVELIANGGTSYSWWTKDSMFNNNTNDLVVYASGTYYVKGTDLNGCSATDSITIYPENPDVVTVSGFIITPNDDGKNDFLWIDNVSEYQNCDVKIFNSWNAQVFNITGYNNKDVVWKGTNASGAPLPAGAYYYIIQCDDKPTVKGNINILR
ncbi:MAG: gliding motility-associated C-terminal domain-containing protein [Bacteroidetes bacterium]|nr:gliding motility-associated C-terminal domain-containing protein [Bacteroidota bacterium]